MHAHRSAERKGDLKVNNPIRVALAKLKELAAEICGDGKLFGQARKEEQEAKRGPSELDPAGRLKDLK